MIRKEKQKKNEKRISFSIQRTLAISRRILTQFRRDRRTFALIIAMPMVIMLIFGLALSGDIKNIPVILDNQDAGFTVGPISLDLGENISESLIADERLDVKIGNYNESKALVEDGDYFAIIHIPENFSETVYQMISGNPVSLQITLYIDGTEPTIRASVLAALRDAITNAMGDRGINVNQILAHGGAEFSGLDVSIPAVMGFVITFLLLILALLTISREKIRGTESRLYTTPLSSAERLLGYVIGLMVMAILMTGAVLLFGTVVFGTVVRGSFLLLILAAFLFGLLNIFLAIFLSNFAENELQAVQFAPLLSIPSMAVSGMLVPVASLPNWLEPISYVVPLTYGINLFEGIMLKGWGFKELWLEFTVVTGMAFVLFVLAVLTVRDKMED